MSISSITLNVYVVQFQVLSLMHNHNYQVIAPDLRSHIFCGSLTFNLQEGASYSICVQHNWKKECIQNCVCIHWAYSISQKNAYKEVDHTDLGAPLASNEHLWQLRDESWADWKSCSFIMRRMRKQLRRHQQGTCFIRRCHNIEQIICMSPEGIHIL